MYVSTPFSKVIQIGTRLLSISMRLMRRIHREPTTFVTNGDGVAGSIHILDFGQAFAAAAALARCCFMNCRMAAT